MVVILKGRGVVSHEGLPDNHQQFELEHAERILNLQKKVPPCVWELSDPNYKLEDGRLITRTDNKTPPKPQK